MDWAFPNQLHIDKSFGRPRRYWLITSVYAVNGLKQNTVTILEWFAGIAPLKNVSGQP